MDIPTAASVRDLILPPATLTSHEAAEAAGMSFEDAQRVWRALGMPHVDETEKAFSDHDVEALLFLKAVMDQGVAFDTILAMTRVVGQSMSRIADVHSRLVMGAESDGADMTLAVPGMIEASGRILDLVHRRHLYAAIRHLSPESIDPAAIARGKLVMGAGFADLVGFSRLSDDLEGSGLTELIARFEQIVIEACADAGVRLVKIVGDAAMFVSGDADLLAKAARDIVDGVSADGSLPSARSGLDYGSVVAVEGDYFGRPVNVAARLTADGKSNEVLASAGLVDALEDRRASFAKAGNRRLRGVGRVTVFKMH